MERTTSTKFTIYSRLPGLNEYTAANRTNKYAGASMKHEAQRIITKEIALQHLHKINNYPVSLKITWFEPNSKRDIDNITFATKFILDSLVLAEILLDDSQKYVNKIEHDVRVDKVNPRIEVEIMEDK